MTVLGRDAESKRRLVGIEDGGGMQNSCGTAERFVRDDSVLLNTANDRHFSGRRGAVVNKLAWSARRGINRRSKHDSSRYAEIEANW